MPTTVYKIGGSLLDLPDLAERVDRMLAHSARGRALLIAGGGPTVNLVRRWDNVHKLGQHRAHALALAAMQLNEALLVELLPRAELVADRSQAEQSWRIERLPILSARAFLEREEPLADLPLPHHWDVTSDSLAAWIAIRWPADALVLVKSIAAPQSSLEGASDTPAAVDAHFRKLAPLLPAIGWVNLRGPSRSHRSPPTVSPWRPGGQQQGPA